MQGQLRKDARISCEVRSSCACCGRELRFSVDGELRYTLEDASAAPVFLIPLVDFTRLRAPNITHDF